MKEKKQQIEKVLDKLQDFLKQEQKIGMSRVSISLIEEYVKQLNNILISPVKTGKFNVLKWVGKDKCRPKLGCLYYKDGFAYATNMHILCKVRMAYDPSFEGKLITPSGEELNEKPLPYEKVIPNGEGFETFDLDFEKLNKVLKEYKIFLKGKKKKDCFSCIKIKTENKEVYFRIDLLEKIATLMNYLGTNKIFVYSEATAAKIVGNDGSVAVIMPLYREILKDSSPEENIFRAEL